MIPWGFRSSPVTYIIMRECLFYMFIRQIMQFILECILHSHLHIVAKNTVSSQRNHRRRHFALIAVWIASWTAWAQRRTKKSLHHYNAVYVRAGRQNRMSFPYANDCVLQRIRIDMWIDDSRCVFTLSWNDDALKYAINLRCMQLCQFTACAYRAYRAYRAYVRI